MSPQFYTKEYQMKFNKKQGQEADVSILDELIGK